MFNTNQLDSLIEEMNDSKLFWRKVKTSLNGVATVIII